MKRCFNCGNLIAGQDRDVCLACLNKVILQGIDRVVVKKPEN